MKPEILTHPNIPKPLHGINPRTIKGDAWWNKIRQEAYERYDYTCIACGVHKSKAKEKKWLEAHEYWDIDYMTGRCEVISIEPLCHFCHNFIHSGRLQMVEGDSTLAKLILSHGFEILSDNWLKVFAPTYNYALELDINTLDVQPHLPKTNPSIKWNDWALVFEGKEYHSAFENFEAWREHYKR